MNSHKSTAREYHVERDTTLFPMGPPTPTFGLLSQLSFWYLNALFLIGYKRPLEHEDVFELPESEHLEKVYPKFANEYDASKESNIRQKWKIWVAFHHAFKWKGLYLQHMWFLFKASFEFSSALLLFGLMKFMTSSQESYIGYIYAVGLFVTTFLSSVCAHQNYYQNVQFGLRVRNAVQHMVFRKSLKLTSKARQQRQTGEIINLVTVDAQKVENVIYIVRDAMHGPFCVSVGLAINIYFFGWTVFTGVAAILLLIPLIGILTRQLTKIEKEINEAKDERVKLMNEILSSIRIIKYFVWESRFEKLVAGVRSTEFGKLKKAAVTKSFQQFLANSIAMAGSAVTFIVYYLVHGELDVSTIFSGMAVFTIMTGPLMNLPETINIGISVYTSMNRIADFLEGDEVVSVTLQEELKEEYEEEEKNNTAIVFRGASFSYDPEKPILHDIDVVIPKGQFVSIVGRVGSGKSSLLSALFGDINKDEGYLSVHGNVSYCCEKPWIVNDTIRQNILFGTEYDEVRYKRVLEVCQLTTDINRMPNKDLTEVGENGINMSPGQQHRLSLARAAYSRSEIVLLDSTLNAVDNTVQANIVKKCIIEFLKEQENRTVLLVTHSLQSLKYADLIIVLDEGRIARRATSWTDIKDEWNTIENADEVEDTEQITEEASVEETIIDSVSPSEPKTDGKIVEKEDRESGSISLSVVKSYFMGYGIPLFLLSLFTGLLAKLGQQSQSIWFAEWSRHKEDKSSFYILIYISLGAVGLLFVFLKSLFFALGNLRSANVLHDKMLRRVLLARMHFFDSNPIGRILNRFTSDQFTVDYSLLFTFSTLYSELINATGVLLVISYVTPMFLILIVPLAIGYYFIQEFYRATSREMRRLESVSRSPLISHVAACIRGTSTIRAYACQSLVFAQNAIRANYFGKHFTVRWNLNRWLGVRVEGIGAMIVFGSAIFAVMRRSTLDPALVGLSISFALQVTQNFLVIIRAIVEVESNLTSCERILHYGSKIAIEPTITVDEFNPTKDITPTQVEEHAVHPAEDWPQAGAISFNNVSVSYRYDIEQPVLKHVQLDVIPGERIGIVGRTGAGKSTMLLCLFRFLECCQGNITIDDLDISKIPLHELRKRITIIPQSPALFSGTIRSNIDVFDEYDDHVIWQALERVHIKDKIEKMPLKLQEPVTEHGSNFSIGEQALISLSRSLLNKTKVIVFDEATAHVDHESDQLIQETIRNEFSDCTTLTIAHRLDTIIGSDRVIVLENGSIVEQGKPIDLLNASNGYFYGLCAENGPEYVASLKEMCKS